MSSKRHTLSKADLLDYALEGATTLRGVNGGNPDCDIDWFAQIDADIAEIERRIKLVAAAEQRKPGGELDPAPEVTKARYAQGMFAIRCPGVGTFKSRAARLCEHLKGRFSHREGAYIMTPSKTRRLQYLWGNGYDAGSLTGQLIQPKGHEE